MSAADLTVAHLRAVIAAIKRSISEQENSLSCMCASRSRMMDKDYRRSMGYSAPSGRWLARIDAQIDEREYKLQLMRDAVVMLSEGLV